MCLRSATIRAPAQFTLDGRRSCSRLSRPLSGVALGQTAPAASIVSDVPVAEGTERLLFLEDRQARAMVLLLPGGDDIIGLDRGGGVHQLGAKLPGANPSVNGSRKGLP
jgi:hypothetical protein